MHKDSIILEGITWNHSRGYVPMVAAGQRFGELNPHVDISWNIRSLQEFADKPVDELALKFDLLVIDHPWMGFAAEHKCFLNLQDCLSASFLEAQAKNSVGFSFESYSFNGTQLAIPLDAATPVASSRPDLLVTNGLSLPEKFEDVMELADKGRVVFPAIPVDTLMNFYMFCSAYGEEPFKTDDRVVSKKIGIKALQTMRELALRIDPACFEWNPIAVYEIMTQEDRFAYCPFGYGYVNYTRKGYAKKPLHFHDLVYFKDERRLKTTLGGAGLAISSHCDHSDMAVEYMKFVASEECQSSLYFESGGQPSHRKAWINDRTNALSNNFFKKTLPALDRAFLRPRYNGNMDFQDKAGAPIREHMMKGGNKDAVLNKLNNLYKNSLR